jgi:hypothetical protein
MLRMQIKQQQLAEQKRRCTFDNRSLVIKANSLHSLFKSLSSLKTKPITGRQVSAMRPFPFYRLSNWRLYTGDYSYTA